MDHDILNQELIRQRSLIEDHIRSLHDMTSSIGNEILSQTVSELRTRLAEPFLFVIVGEVKVGKSSFINALLETQKEVCKVAPDPCTDTIQQIVYGEKEETVVVNPYLKKIFFPVKILQEIAIVDTPGTNTISAYHQEITEGFVPGADLVVFVFEAKNPYRQSAWEFFDFIHTDWRKKIIFVLQQSDLLPAEDLRINEEGVRKFAIQKGLDNPKIFSVSAKLELEGKHETSGFPALREHISSNITGGQAPLLKLQNNVNTSLEIASRIKSGLDIRALQLEADLQFRGEVDNTLEQQEKRSGKQVDMLVENLLAGYDKATRNAENELSSGLGFWTLTKKSFLSLFSKQQSIQEWLSNLTSSLEKELRSDLETRLRENVYDLAEQVQQMAKIIDLKLRSSKTILKNSNEIFGDIAERRTHILQDLQVQFSKFMEEGENFLATELFDRGKQISPQIATGSGLAVIGVILATVTQGMVFDITGGILTTIGLLFAGVTTRIKRKQILNSYNKEIEKGRVKLNEELTGKLKAYILHLKNKISSNFDDFDDMLEQEEKQVGQLNDKHDEIVKGLMQISHDLENNLK